jgi:hypothetical protein
VFVADRVSSTWDLIGERLALLHSLLTDEAVEVVTERYRAWKDETRAALDGSVEAGVLEDFDRVRGVERRGIGHRPTPAVYLDGAASRAFLNALRKELESEIPTDRVGRLKLLELLERRLGTAFRGAPQTERELQDGLETLLSGASIEYTRGDRPGPAFVFKPLHAVLELKLSAGPGREEEIVASIREDIEAWRSFCKHLVFGVCHDGFVRETEFAQAFKSEDGVLVRLIRLS